MPTDLDPRERKIIIIAGPNGAGKTTFADAFLPEEARCPVFLNADLIAAGLDPFNPEQAAFRAGRLMLEEIHSRVSKRESFAFETTLSGRGYAKLIPAWQADGYVVMLFFLRLPTPEHAINRVAKRVSEGGHNIPEMVIRRRFEAGLHNFERLYKPLVDRWLLYNSFGKLPILIEEGEAMSKQSIVSDKGIKPRSALAIGAQAALIRAAKKARERAKQAGHGIVIWDNGQVVEVFEGDPRFDNI